MHYHLIVHKEDVAFVASGLNTTISKEQRELALQALATIDHLINSDSRNVLEIPKSKDSNQIPKEIKPGDSVTLYGAYLGMCLPATQITLVLMGINAEYHPQGII